jgi:hypothetical protein
MPKPRLMIELVRRRPKQSPGGCTDRCHVAVTRLCHITPVDMSHGPVRSNGASSPFAHMPMFSFPENLQAMDLTFVQTWDAQHIAEILYL